MLTPSSWVRRPVVWLAVVATGLVGIVATGRGPVRPVGRRGPVPVKTEKLRVTTGPDSPDEAMRWIQMGQRDEFGNIAPNGVINAMRQADAMRALDRAARPAAPGGALPSVAGITPNGWTWIGPGNVGGRTRAIAIDPTTPSTLFVGSVGGGIWKTTDSGAHWAVVDTFSANLAVSSIVFQPGNPSVMFAGTGEGGIFNVDAIQGAGIFTSADSGATWTQLDSTAPTTLNQNFLNVNELAFSADGTILIAATPTGVWRSTDLGGTFTRTFNLTNVMDVKFLPGSNANVVVGTRVNTGYYSTGGGATGTWAQSVGLVQKPNGVSARVELAGSVSSPNVVYASVAAGGGSSTPVSEVWKSTDNGATYSQLPAVPTPSGSLLGAQGWYDNAIWVDPTDANTLIVGGIDLYRSRDGGATFTKISSWQSAPTSAHADHHVIVNDPGFDGVSNKRVYFGNDGGVYKADDVYATPGGVGIPFTVLNNNYGVTQFYGGDGLPSNGKIFGGTQDNGTLLYTPANGPQAWTATFGGDGGFSTADRTNNYLYGEYVTAQVHRSNNGGFASYIINCGGASPLSDACNGTANFIAPVVLDPNNPDRLLAGGLQLWLSANPRAAAASDVAWSSIKASANSNLTAIAVAPGNSDVIWTGQNNGVPFVTTDGTSATPTWTQRNVGLPGRIINSIAVDPADSSTAYVGEGAFVANNVWVTHDLGAHWTNISGTGGGALPAVPVRSVVPHPSVSGWLYAATDIGVFSSEDGGASWHIPQDGPANVAVFQLFWMGTKLVAVTHGRGMYTVETLQLAPVIATQPASQTIASGQTALLGVVATGDAPLTYQWYAGASGNTGSPIGAATLTSYTTPTLSATTSYWVRVTNDSGSADSATATITIAAASGVELMTNGAFASGTTGWQFFEEPDIVHNSGAGGEFHFYKANPTTTGSGQAVVYQQTGQGVVPFGPVTATFDIGNSDTVRKRISVLIIDSNFSDLSVCTFYLPASSGLQTYQMKTHSTKGWANAAIYFYAASGGGSASAGYLLDNVSLKYESAGSVSQTTCVDPTAPAPPGGAAGPNLLTNGDFGTGVTSPWSLFGDLTSQVTAGVFEFIRPGTPGQPAGVIFQSTGQTPAQGDILTASFQLGNSSSVRKRVTVLLQDLDFSDLTACTFWLPPAEALSTYTMRSFATKAWANATLSVYAATTGTDQWMRLDNVSLQKTPGTAALGTECLEPVLGPAAFGGGAATTGTGGASITVDGTTRTVPALGSGGFTSSRDAAGGGTGAGWSAEAGVNGRAVLALVEPVDLTAARSAQLTFNSSLSAGASSGFAQVSVDGVTWRTVASAPKTGQWTTVGADLGAFVGHRIYLRFVFDRVAPARGASADVWRIGDVVVTIAGAPHR